MSDTAPHRHRRERTRGAARGSTALPPLPRLKNPWAPIEIFNAEQVERLVEAAYTLLETGGVEILLKRARDIYRDNGCVVDDESQMVRLPRDVVQNFMQYVPEKFVLRSRNRERDLHVGGNVVNFGPVNGAPNVADLTRGRRYGDLEAFRDIIKLTHALGIVHWQGGVVVEPVDVPVPVRHLEMYNAHIQYSDIVWAGRGIGAIPALDAVKMSAIEHQCSIDDIMREPTLMLVTNVNSPRRVDEELLEGILTYAEHNQCCCITPFTLMGAMAPVTLAGALVQQTAEALAVIVLVQMVRKGCPCVLGGFTSNVDMRSGSPAFGTPEYVNATLGGAQLARRLKIPYRTSAVNASPAVDAQSTYETAFSLWASIMSHSHLINHAAGWLEGGLVASFEKIIVDAEMLRSWAEILKPIDFTDDEIGLDAIREVAPGGHFFGSPHTQARYKTAFYQPILSDWSNFENWRDAGARDATHRAETVWKRVLESYVPPPLDDAVKAELEEYVARRKIELGV